MDVLLVEARDAHNSIVIVLLPSNFIIQYIVIGGPTNIIYLCCPLCQYNISLLVDQPIQYIGIGRLINKIYSYCYTTQYNIVLYTILLQYIVTTPPLQY